MHVPFPVEGLMKVSFPLNFLWKVSFQDLLAIDDLWMVFCSHRIFSRERRSYENLFVLKIYWSNTINTFEGLVVTDARKVPLRSIEVFWRSQKVFWSNKILWRSPYQRRQFEGLFTQRTFRNLLVIEEVFGFLYLYKAKDNSSFRNFWKSFSYRSQFEGLLDIENLL